MSEFIRRIGTKKQIFSYDITIHSLKIRLNRAVKINIVWKRSNVHSGKKRIETKSKPALSPAIGLVEINETITMINTLYQEKSGEFRRKKAVLTVQGIVDDNSIKKIGSLTINLSDFCTDPLLDKNFLLEECQDKKAEICISISSTPLGNIMLTDNISQGSGVTGFSMGTGTNFSGTMFLEQENSSLAGDSARIIPGTNGKPPIVRGPIKKTQENDLLSPVKLVESYENPDEKIDYTASKLVEAQAKLQLLEKELLLIKTEKDDLRVQLGISLEKSKKDRENCYEHMKNLDNEIQELKAKNEKIHERAKRRSEKNKILKEKNENLINDLKEAEENIQISSKTILKLKSEKSELKAKLAENETKLKEVSQKIEALLEEKNSIESDNKHLDSINSQLKAELENEKKNLLESREATPRSPETDLAFDNFRKKTENIIKNYRKNMKSLEIQKEDALSKQDELAIEIQKIKSEHRYAIEMSKKQIYELQHEIDSLNEEIADLKQKLDEEARTCQNLKYRSSIEKTDAETRLSRLTYNFTSLKTKKKSIKESVKNYEKLLNENKKEYENCKKEYKKLIEKCDKLEAKSQQYKVSIMEKNKEVEGLFALRASLEEENRTLREHLKKATVSEFSDPANVILQEQLKNLQNKIRSVRCENSKDKALLVEKNKILENQVRLLEKKKEDLTASYENTISKLAVENNLLKDQSRFKSHPSRPTSTSEFIAEIEKENNDHSVSLLKAELKEANTKLDELQLSFKDIEKKYIDAKMNCANAELEKENFMQKCRVAQEEIKEYSVNYTMMEVELYKINDKFGQAINSNNELELEIKSLRKILDEKNQKKKKKFF